MVETLDFSVILLSLGESWRAYLELNFLSAERPPCQVPSPKFEVHRLLRNLGFRQ